MTDLNSVTIIGRLTKDLDDKSYQVTANGTARARISVAVNRSVKKDNQRQDEASYFDVTIWGKTAENLKTYLRKGTQVAVQGYLKQDRWKDQNGQNRSSVGIVSENIQLVGGKRDGQAPNQGAAQGYSQPQQSFNPADGFPEDMPF